MTLQDNLESAIALHWTNGHRPPRCIIAHPKTVREFVREILYSKGPLYLTQDIRYNGIRVYRSEDVKENEFEIF